MTVICPKCLSEIPPQSGGICPSCGPHFFSDPGLTADPRERLIRFHTTLLRMTPVTWAIPTIVGANVLIFVAMLAAGAGLFGPPLDMMRQWGANFGPLTLGGQWWRLFTCTFLHFGVVHLGFNMYVLWQIGHFVERLVGNVGLLILYVAAGIAASIASLAWNPTLTSAGASGAVFGVCGALLGFIVLRRDTIPMEVIKGLRSSMMTFVIYNAAFALLLSFIDWAAHAGGFVYGICCGMILSQPVVAESTRSRWKRNSILVVASAVILPAACWLLPPAPPDVVAEVNNVLSMDAKTSQQAVSLINQWQQNALTSEQVVEALQRQVLPNLQQAIDTVDSFGAQSTVKPEFLVKLRRSLLKRHESIQTLVDAIRSDDQQKAGQFAEAWKEAEALQAELIPEEQP